MSAIIYISKYPPLEGGIASKTYWLAKALARAGHTIHVVTDPEAVDSHLTIPNADHSPETPGVFVHRADQIVPWHIPNDSHRVISLLDKTLEIVAKEKPDLIVGGYLVPYGIIASHLSSITGIPLVLMHGGSDIRKFLLNGVWPHILPEALAKASQVVTDCDNQVHIRRFTNNITVLPPYVPDPSAFAKFPRPASDTITLALIGKANYHWRHKGWEKIVDLWVQLSEKFRLVVVSQGIGLEDVKASVPRDLVNRINWFPFFPPWHMPALLRTIDGLLYSQELLPFPMFSNTVLEALACGTTVIADSADILEDYRRHGIDIGYGEKGHLPFTLFDPEVVNSIMTTQFAKQSDCAVWDCAPSFNRYISSIEYVFFEAIEKHSGHRTLSGTL